MISKPLTSTCYAPWHIWFALGRCGWQTGCWRTTQINLRSRTPLCRSLMTKPCYSWTKLLHLNQKCDFVNLGCILVHYPSNWHMTLKSLDSCGWGGLELLHPQTFVGNLFSHFISESTPLRKFSLVQSDMHSINVRFIQNIVWNISGFALTTNMDCSFLVRLLRATS